MTVYKGEPIGIPDLTTEEAEGLMEALEDMNRHYVYVLSNETPCEGGWVKGVYSTLEAAQAASDLGWGWIQNDEDTWTAEANFEYDQIKRWEVNA